VSLVVAGGIGHTVGHEDRVVLGGFHGLAPDNLHTMCM
jgi:hypothetical protein